MKNKRILLPLALLLILFVVVLALSLMQPDFQNEAASASKQAVLDKLTVDYDSERLAYYLADNFVMMLMPHWEPVFLLKDWEELYPMRDVKLIYDDAEYGSVELSFRGVSFDDFMTCGGISAYYEYANVYNRSGGEFRISKDDALAREIYLMMSCEGRVFGYPADGGCGPVLMIATKDGRADIISDQIVNMSVKNYPNTPF